MFISIRRNFWWKNNLVRVPQFGYGTLTPPKWPFFAIFGEHSFHVEDRGSTPKSKIFTPSGKGYGSNNISS